MFRDRKFRLGYYRLMLAPTGTTHHDSLKRMTRLLRIAAITEFVAGLAAALFEVIEGSYVPALIVVVATTLFSCLCIATIKRAGEMKKGFILLTAVAQMYALLLLGYSLALGIEFAILVRGGVWIVLGLFPVAAAPPIVGIFVFAVLRRRAESSKQKSPKR